MNAVAEVPTIVRVQRGEVDVYCRCGEILRVNMEELLRKRKVEVRCKRGHVNVVELKEVLFVRVNVSEQ
jgi:lysyl-tRNA synthetase class I